MVHAPLIVVGAGGHAKVVVATARAAGWTIRAVVDDDARRWDDAILGIRVTGPTGALLGDRDAMCVLAIGNNRTRRHLAEHAACGFATIVHPSAIVDPTVALGAGSVVFAGCVIQPDTRIGAHAIVNTGASIDHDCAIGDAVHIAPGARLAGGVTLGDEVFVGIGAVIIPGVTVGTRATIGAGAAVLRGVANDAVVVGVPAKPR